MIAGNPFRQRACSEYETSSLCTPHRLVALILNRIFGRANGKFYKIGWIPPMYHVTMQGTIFNWADSVSKNLSSCIGVALRGLLQRKSEFYMGSYLIDCILCLYTFLKLNCSWNESKTPIYTAYHILWAHKYHKFYKLICKELLIPLYQLIFLEECKCMSKGSLEVISEYGD